MPILIRFLHPVPDEPGVALGEITLGTFVEVFEMALTTWNVEHYQQQWDEGIQRILSCASKSCLITSFWSEKNALGGEWWMMYRVQDQVVIQNQLIRPDVFDQRYKNFDADNPYSSIPDRKTVTDDGQKISEWSVPFNQITPLPPLK